MKPTFDQMSWCRKDGRDRKWYIEVLENGYAVFLFHPDICGEDYRFEADTLPEAVDMADEYEKTDLAPLAQLIAIARARDAGL